MTLTLPEMTAYLISKGWKIQKASCRCGGDYMWLKPSEYGGADISAGCICHFTESNYTEAREKELNSNLREYRFPYLEVMLWT